MQTLRSSRYLQAEVVFTEGLDLSFPEETALRQVLEQDPRPQFQDDPGKVYGMLYNGHDVRFMVEGKTLKVIETKKL